MASNDFEHEALANITEATLKNLDDYPAVSTKIWYNVCVFICA